MSMTDPVADFLTRIRNGILASHTTVDIPSSGLKKEMARILTEQGYIQGFDIEAPTPDRPSEVIRVTLKYTEDRRSAISGLRRVSRPGQRHYAGKDGVRVAQRQLEVAALEHRAVADALDLQALLEAGGHALDHVGHERARQPVQGAVLAAVGRALDEQLLAVLLDGNVARDALAELTPGAVDPDELGLDGDGHARGHRDGLSADAAHAITRCARRPRRRRPRRGPRGRSSHPSRWTRSRFPCRRGPWGSRCARRNGAGRGARRA